jgi:GTP pyrophosphokinase
MFVAMTDDYRIIVVKLADRLHNMRTLRYMKPEKQIKISRETLDIFAPLAHRMGIWQFKSELEDTSFMYLYPAEYKRLHRRLRRHQAKFRETLEKSQQILQMTLENNPTLREQAVQVKVSGRTKELYSLWHKMQTKGENNLDHITDVVALRVIIDPKQPSSSVSSADGNSQKVIDESNYLTTAPMSLPQVTQSPSSSSQVQNMVGDSNVGVWLCYHVLGLVQHLPGFQPVPTKVKDYISFPKPNGYQSLHTALMLNGQTIEVQIRTTAMHRIAEYGMASHWAYKDGKKREASNQSTRELYNTPWLSSIKEWQNEALCSRDFVDCVRRELLGKRVFVFLRNGKILNLAKGATVIDAAFQIHTEVGLTMHGVEINGKPVPFSYELRNGDVVSVLTGKGKPATDWMKYAKIRSTRSKLRSYFRKKQRESLRDAGAILLMDFLGMYEDLIQTSSFLERPFQVPSTPEELSLFLPGKTQYNDVEELLTDIGNSHDRDLLRTAVAKLFLVPKKVLVSAEEDRSENLSKQILSAVNRKRQNALDVGAAIATEGGIDFVTDDTDYRAKMGFDDEYDVKSCVNTQSYEGVDVGDSGKHVIRDIQSSIDSSFEKIEIADPDHLCEKCLPIFGDDIIGTRPVGKECITTVHRCGCPIAQKAINQSKSLQGSRQESSSGLSYTLGGLVSKISKSSSKESITKRLKARLSKNHRNILRKQEEEILEAVKLKWDKSYMEGEDILYMTELSIIAQDRKFLLADCSEIVSDMSEIVRTGSLSTKEHAIFQFLTKVQSLEHLQKLMDSLMEVRSVMSVERKFGSF